LCCLPFCRETAIDSDHFDRLTRMLGRRVPRRRGVVLFSALSLGLAAGSPCAAAKARKNKHKGEEKCNGRWFKRCPPGKIRSLSDCTCFCIAAGCCPDEKICGSNCIPKVDCCDATERTCRKTVKKRGKKRTVTFCVT
jgi:hypothetical protein